MKKDISEELTKKTEEKIKEILDGDITPNNIEHLYQLVDILKDTKEVENMNYGYNYGGRPGYDSYGNYSNYGRSGYDMKYRGDDTLNRMHNEYGRYMESRSRYGAGEETDK